MFGFDGVITSTCSGQQLPSYDEMYNQFKDLGIDDVYCMFQ